MKGVSCDIPGACKCGIVGRTASGNNKKKKIKETNKQHMSFEYYLYRMFAYYFYYFISITTDDFTSFFVFSYPVFFEVLFSAHVQFPPTSLCPFRLFISIQYFTFPVCFCGNYRQKLANFGAFPYRRASRGRYSNR